MTAPKGAVLLEAARPRTLVAGAVPVVVGTAAAGAVDPWRFAAALVVSLSLQVAVNFANDLFDARRGVDTPERLGPRRTVSSGLLSERAAGAVVAACFAVAALAGGALAIAVGPELLAVGAACFLAALGYSGGPRPYGSAALGELLVFVFFGLVATAGSAYVQTERLEAVAVAAALPVGLLAAAILLVNNVRDLPTDRRAGKRTLAVVLGAPAARRAFGALVLASFPGVALVALAAHSAWPLLALAALPAARPPLALAGADDPAKLVGALVGTARLEAVLGLLLAAGLWLAR
ncbi:MAG TPA: 1,4-dihydroxy-2-naphthoate polyprenyltransferase [Actinomycetota bacterium]|nr:1,4-dihydroxy-2-naphthoate polyprenyltransferase [Actinomycetota bacterium]